VKHSAALVPKPRVNLTRFHGVFAPNSKFRVLVTPARRGIRIECQHTAGFEPPMDHYPVRIQKNRALPLKAELFDYAVVLAKSDADLAAPPVVQVMLNGPPTGDVDVSDDALPAGQGSEGNQFVFTDEDKWQFNLKTGQFEAPGTYIVWMESGDPDAYAFVPQCVTEFEIR